MLSGCLKTTNIYKDMAPRKGITNNPKGRPRGVPNKTTSDLRKWVDELLNKNISQIEKDMRVLEPHQRVAIFERMLQYLLPKRKQSSIEDQIQAEYSELERMLINMPEKAIDEITERIIKLNKLNKQDNEG